ncbi:MAG: sugar-transfer associated ATP-grasp domain-containing protein [Parahaliea sp.]
MHLLDNIAKGWVIEQYIKQHDLLMRLNASSVNTLRIWLLQQQGEVRLLGAILRIGRKGNVVDNSSRGGLLAKVDLATGKLEKAKNAVIFPDFHTHHPDSGAQIENLTLPFWVECQELAKQALRVFPKASFTGLDMAITATGPVVVELNLEPDRITARNFDRPLMDLLNW